MNLNAIKQIYKFNQEAGLLDKGYSDERECAFPIEEALEGFEDLRQLSEDISGDYDLNAKEISRKIMTRVALSSNLDVDRLDKHLDIIVFSFGSIFKLGLTPQEAMKALGIVMDANMQKLSAGTDEQGKQKKPKDFVGPEEKLQKIIDEVNKRSNNG